MIAGTPRTDDPDELYDFVDDFKMVAAENVLKLFLRDGAEMNDCQGRKVGTGREGGEERERERGREGGKKLVCALCTYCHFEVCLAFR